MRDDTSPPPRLTADRRLGDRLWARARRKVAVLSGAVPVWQMSEAEVVWALGVAVRVGGDRADD